MSGHARASGGGASSSTPASLYLEFLKIGTMGFGGGMAVISLMEREFVRKRRLLASEEFVQGVGLGQILGSFAVNAAFFVGYRLFGVFGGFAACAAFLLPSFVLVAALSEAYFRYHSLPAMQGVVAGLGPVAIALILNAGYSLGRIVVRSRSTAALAVAALLAGAFRINAVWVLLASGAVGYLLVREPRNQPVARAANPPARSSAPAVFPLVFGLPALGAIAAQFLKIGLVFFGGGFVLLPLLHDRLVTGLHWLTPREFLDGVAISNLTPGPIAVLATFAGYKVAGLSGAAVATLAIFAPGLALMLLLGRQYEKHRTDARVARFLAGVNPAVAGLVVSAAFLLAGSALISWRGWALGAVSFYLLARRNWHPVFVLAIGALAGGFGALP